MINVHPDRLINTRKAIALFALTGILQTGSNVTQHDKALQCPTNITEKPNISCVTARVASLAIPLGELATFSSAIIYLFKPRADRN